MEKYFWFAAAAYLLIINIIGWIAVYADKRKAQKNRWRIRERTLFVLSAIGGAVGVYSAMHHFRHKTKHKRFMIGIPLIAAAEIALICVTYWIIK